MQARAVPVPVKRSVVCTGIEMAHDRICKQPDRRPGLFRRIAITPPVPCLHVIIGIHMGRIPGQFDVEVHGHHISMVGLRRNHKTL